ncbi:hypothetical protein ACF0H5_024414 [Mactra antiquata]
MLTILKNICIGDENDIGLLHGRRKNKTRNVEIHDSVSDTYKITAPPRRRIKMDDVLVPGSEMDMEFIEKNPEAIFDFITIKQIQERYGNIQPPPPTRDTFHKNEAVYQNEAEFETFVQQFPIDDSIAECFASANGSVNTKSEDQFVSGGKRPQISTKYSKLKKKFGWKGADDTSLLSEDEGRSRESKRSKKGGGVFSKRHKWRNFGHGALSSSSKKSVNFSDHSEKSGSENTSDLADTGSSFGPHRIRHSTRSDDVVLTDSFSMSDSQITSFSETLAKDMDQTVPGHYDRISSHLTTQYGRGMDTNQYKSRNKGATLTSEYVEMNDTIATILSGDSGEIIQKIEDLEPSEVIKLRDLHGNNLLHRAVLQGNADVVKYILEKYTEMTSEMNFDNETGVELAVRQGKYDCLKVILERNQRRKSLGVSLINRLLNISAQHGQAECLVLILTYMSRDSVGTCTLPGDTRGNTAAHLAAKHGHLQCLQALVSAGCDVMSENLMQQRPLHVAHQSRSQACFEYLLLLNICEELLTSLRTQVQINLRLHDQMSSVKPSLEHIRLCLNRYQTLCSETSQLLNENKVSVLQTLNDLQEELKRFVQHTSMDTATKRKEARQKIDELRAEVECLEDTFEFSPLVELDSALSKLLVPLDEIIGSQSDDIKLDDFETLSKEDNCSVLSSLIRDIHKESMLENWETSGIYSRYLKRSDANNSMDDQPSFTEINSSPTYMTHTDLRQMQGEENADADELSGSEHTEYANINHALTGTVRTGNALNDDEDINDGVKAMNAVREELPTFPEAKSVNENIKLRGISEDKLSVRKMDDSNFSTKMETGVRKLDKSDFSVKSSSGTMFAGNVGKEVTSTQQLRNINETPNEHSECDTSRSNADNSASAKLDDPTERPFAKLLSLDERIDLLIAGERDRERISDNERGQSSSDGKGSSNGVGSVYTSTFTSITSDTSVTSDWYSKHGLTSLDTASSDDVTYDLTSDTTPSYWWDIGEDKSNSDTYEFKRSMPYGIDIKRKIHLNLENDESSFNELREQRLKSHLRSMHQTRYPSNHYRERITTSTGEVIGGFHDAPTEERVLVDVNSALKERQFHQPIPKPRKRDNSKLFTLNDAIATKPLSESEFRDRYDRVHMSGATNRWEDMSITDDEDRGSLAWSREIESSGSQTPQSYV